ncbi:hypothetical protein [Rufibacter soli]
MELFYSGEKSEKELDRLNSISKTSSTIIRTAKLELEYAKYKGKSTEIPFLSSGKEETAQ